MLKKIMVFAQSIVLSFAAGALGSLATIPNIPSWYAALEKPALNPPNWIFGPVWSLLYFLMGVALALIILQSTKRSKKKAYLWFSIQLLLNTLWSMVFFGFHLPWAGVAVIALLVASILLTMYEFDKISRWASWLLAPYLAWVCFATYLTISIALLNS